VTTLRLSVGHNQEMMRAGFPVEVEPWPAILCSFPYLGTLDRLRDRLGFRDWSMDSGAFTAHQKGVAVDLDAYIACCQERLATDPKLVEVFALDAIGDPRRTLENTERMWAAGVPAIPCYHYGEPVDYLLHYAARYPKIALGGMAMLKGPGRLAVIRQCFARVWPHLVHGFGITHERQLMAVPWHSVDSSSWESNVARYGRPVSLGLAHRHQTNGEGKRHRVLVNYRDMARLEVERFLDLERQAQARWGPDLARMTGAQGSPA
jgi:hypothetical protein